jgi:hypothetical protein
MHPEALEIALFWNKFTNYFIKRNSIPYIADGCHCLEHLVIYNHCLSDNVRIFRSTLETIGKGCPKLKHLAMGPWETLLTHHWIHHLLSLNRKGCYRNVILHANLTLKDFHSAVLDIPSHGSSVLRQLYQSRPKRDRVP